ncbi:hypothetical protein diail_4511 [Diaporthe ilicicola]|nr:hypothetical protein diail_4511 [Diaporthe ilicicola]
MFPRILYLSLVLSFLFTAALSYPTWYLAVFQFRCKAPSIVESYSEDWREWRVSSICAPGTCCATSASTGPLCTAEACEKADQERERKLKSYNAVQASKKKMEDATKAKQSQTKSKSNEAETKWKVVDSQAEADRQKALAKITLSA